MAIYEVFVTRTYSGYVEIEAENEERAEEYAWAQLANDTIEPLEFDAEDTVEVCDIVEGDN